MNYTKQRWIIQNGELHKAIYISRVIYTKWKHSHKKQKDSLEKRTVYLEIALVS